MDKSNGNTRSPIASARRDPRNPVQIRAIIYNPIIPHKDGATSNEQPATSNEQPATSNEQPGTSNNQQPAPSIIPHPTFPPNHSRNLSNILTLLKTFIMVTTIKINTDALTPEFIEGIKKLFPHKTVEITIQSADDTEYILSNPKYAKVLEDRIAEYEAKKQVISLKTDEII